MCVCVLASVTQAVCTQGAGLEPPSLPPSAEPPPTSFCPFPPSSVLLLPHPLQGRTAPICADREMRRESGAEGEAEGGGRRRRRGGWSYDTKEREENRRAQREQAVDADVVNDGALESGAVMARAIAAGSRLI